jgi:DNA phosphorothioation-associated putative methyltransferase
MPESTKNISFGKKVKGALYIHAEGKPFLDKKNQEMLEKALAIVGDIPEFNVLKFEKSSISLLAYEDFAESAFPALLYSTYVDLEFETAKFIDYSKRDNPPILHRKELLLPPNHPKFPEFSAITRLADSRNLFSEPTKIGFRQQWSALIEGAGLQIVGPKLFEKGTDQAEVLRHRTALSRRDLSQPVQLLLLNGILEKGRAFFDYGCGQGTDFNALLNSGYEAFGWDPHHLPTGKRSPADIVNLGFVLNVIEDPHERLETLMSAWSFSRKALCIAVMVSGKIDLTSFKPFRDGVLTSRNTFQKYFNQQELRDYVANATGETPISLGPGIIVVFKDKALEQDVAFKRSLRSLSSISGITVPRISSQAKSKPQFNVLEVLAEEIVVLWSSVLEKGRLLDPIEFPSDLSEALKLKRVSPHRFLSLVTDQFVSDPQFKLAEDNRREDLLVHLALGFFPGSKRSNSFSDSVSKDIRYFFGSQKQALSTARDQLFRAGDLSRIEDALNSALSQQLGAMKDKDTFRCSRSSVDYLPLVLRLIIHCAGVLRGGIDGVDFVDIKKDGKRINFLSCLDPNLYFPVVSERNRVDLGRVKSSVDFPKGKVIYWKSKFMSPRDSNFDAQSKIDAKLLRLGIINEDGDGPDYVSLKKLLYREG